MENAVDALKMAGSVLLFVFALSIAILTLTQSRVSIDAILKYSDRESLTIPGDKRFYYLADDTSDTTRYVGKETIIPTIYRACNENYKIIFKFPDSDDYYLFKKDNEKVCKIDSGNKELELSPKFLDGILYGDYEYEEGKTKQDFENRFKIDINTTSTLYKYLTTKENEGYKIKEELGTYYMEDVVTNPEDDSEQSSIEEVNKQEKRVITYTFVK